MRCRVRPKEVSFASFGWQTILTRVFTPVESASHVVLVSFLSYCAVAKASSDINWWPQHFCLPETEAEATAEVCWLCFASCTELAFYLEPPRASPCSYTSSVTSLNPRYWDQPRRSLSPYFTQFPRFECPLKSQSHSLHYPSVRSLMSHFLSFPEIPRHFDCRKRASIQIYPCWRLPKRTRPPL